MRELSIVDMEIVSGGLNEGEALAAGIAIGGGVGLSVAAQMGLSATQGLTIAGIGSTIFGAVTASFLVGWAIGTGLNEHTPIQSWISSMINYINTGDSDG